MYVYIMCMDIYLKILVVMFLKIKDEFLMVTIMLFRNESGA